MIKMTKKDFEKLIEQIASGMFQDQVNEWRNQDMQPAIINEPPVEKGLTVIDPKSDLQVADENMPIDDSDWKPGNPGELARAMKQMAGMVPEGSIEWFYDKVKLLVDKSLDHEDQERMQPRLG